MRTVLSKNNGLDKTLSYCLQGLEKLQKLAHPCVSKHFIFPKADTYGLSKPRITLPSLLASCDHMFGEQYVYSSCNGKCSDSPCPLKTVPTLFRYFQSNPGPGCSAVAPVPRAGGPCFCEGIEIKKNPPGRS